MKNTSEKRENEHDDNEEVGCNGSSEMSSRSSYCLDTELDKEDQDNMPLR